MMDWLFRAYMVRVIDGDTFEADVDLGFSIRHRLTFRLLGIDTPEMHGPDKERGEAAKEFTSQSITPGSPMVIKSTKQEKYGRYLAEVWYSVGPFYTPTNWDPWSKIFQVGLNLADELRKAGHVKIKTEVNSQATQ